jgi:hypothetical protein
VSGNVHRYIVNRINGSRFNVSTLSRCNVFYFCGLNCAFKHQRFCHNYENH